MNQLMSQMAKDIAKMSGQQVFEEFAVTQKRIKLYEGILKRENERLGMLSDVIYKGRIQEGEHNDTNGEGDSDASDPV